MNYILSVLLAGVLLWLCLITNVEAPRSEIYRPAPPAPANWQIPCHERARVCQAIARLEKVKKEKT